MDHDNRHICCAICRIPIQSPDTKLYYCACDTIICEICERTRKCASCTLGNGALKRIYLFFKDEDEQDKAVKEHLEGTYFDILAEQHDHLNEEIQTCHDVSKRLKRSIQMVQEAADLAKKRKADMIARQQKRITQLESLRILVQKKEEELRSLQSGECT